MSSFSICWDRPTQVSTFHRFMNTSVMMCWLSQRWSRFAQFVMRRNTKLSRLSPESSKNVLQEQTLAGQRTNPASWGAFLHSDLQASVCRATKHSSTRKCACVGAGGACERRKKKKKRGCLVVTHHINKVQRGLITRTSICQAGRPYVSFLHGGLFVSCDFLQLPVMNTGLCIPD